MKQRGEEMKVYFGIDIGGHEHWIHFIDDQKRTLVEKLVISDDLEGYEKLVSALRKLISKYPDAEFRGGAEATGIYWRNLFFYFQRVLPEVKLTLINPLQTKRFKDLELKRIHTDAADCKNIARYMATIKPEPTRLTDHKMVDLCELTRYRKIKLKEYSVYRNHLHKYLKIAFPELCGRIKRFSGLKYLAVISRYPTAGRVKEAEEEELAACRYGKRNYHVGIKTARKIKELSLKSVASSVGEGVGFSIQSMAANLLRLQGEIDAFNAKIEQLYNESPATTLTTIPGIAGLSAAVIESEIKNISRFKHPKKLVGYIGAYPQLRQSGVSFNPHPRMTHKGNRYLNQAIYMCVLNAISPNAADNTIKHYYYRLISSGKNRMVAIGSCMRKMIHIVYAILVTGKNYRPDYEFPKGSYEVRFIDRKTANFLKEDEISDCPTVVAIKYKTGREKKAAPKAFNCSS